MAAGLPVAIVFYTVSVFWIIRKPVISVNGTPVANRFCSHFYSGE